MTKHASHAPAGHEQRIIDLLNLRGSHAVEINELMRGVGLVDKALWCALERLEKKGLVFRWSNEKYQVHIVLARLRSTAFYVEPKLLKASVFGPAVEIMVTRTIPFVRLVDEGVAMRNRYAEAVA